MPIPLSAATLSLGRRVCTALLGVDQLARCDGEDYALVVVNMDLELEFAPEPYGTWDEARVAWEVIQLDAAKLPELDRRTYYDQLCRSTLCFIAWRHKGISFQEQLAGFLHCAAQPATEAELQAIQDEIYELLGGLGYNGDLAERCAAWEESCRVPAEHVPAVASQLMSEAWDRCNSDLLPDGIPAPKSDAMQVKPVSGVAFNARCGYLDRTIELNVDPVLTLPSLKHLAVHEACPGHYVQFKMREHMYRNGEAAADVLLSSVFEGIADTGMEMLEWIENDDDRVQALMNTYRMGVCTVAAWKLHALSEPEGAVQAWLEKQTFTGGAGWVSNRMKFLSNPGRAVLIWSYWHGEPNVTRVWASVEPNDRPDFLRWMYGRMHSTRSINMFFDAKAEANQGRATAEHRAMI